MYNSYIAWHGSSIVIPMKRTPKLFKLLSSKACKMFRKFLEPNKERRPKNVSDLQKFIDDRWLAKGAEKNIVGQYNWKLNSAFIIILQNKNVENMI